MANDLFSIQSLLDVLVTLSGFHWFRTKYTKSCEILWHFRRPKFRRPKTFSAILESIYNQRSYNTSCKWQWRVYFGNFAHNGSFMCFIVVDVAWCHPHHLWFLYCLWVNHTIHRKCIFHGLYRTTTVSFLIDATTHSQAIRRTILNCVYHN